jgi:pimeloyl-ACP methyl ester carboxylesterase
MTGSGPVFLQHAKVSLAVHHLREGSGRPLLLLHGLGERSPRVVPSVAEGWPGPVHALDFTGHGASTVPHGGGYTCELLMADADAAIAHLGASTVLGRGLGAYIALLIAGARPADVRGAVLADGPGLIGGATGPVSPHISAMAPADLAAPDPFALDELSRDVRPRDYAATFVRQATHGSGLDTPVAVAAVARPAWLQAVADEVGVLEAPVAEALARYATVA